MFYRFYQNNSGGSFKKPAKNIIVEADSQEEAEAKFLSIDGAYYDPEFLIDCPCCGSRWSSGLKIDKKELKDLISNKYKSWVIWEPKIPRLLVVYKDKNPQIYKEDTKDPEVYVEGQKKKKTRKKRFSLSKNIK